MVRLEWYEHLFASFVGASRTQHARKDGNHRELLSGRDPVATDICAAAAEMAAAKALNVYWPCSVNTFKKGSDIGRITEVRHTDVRTGMLRVGVNDPDDRPYVLVRGAPPNLEVVGWIWGRDAKHEKWRKYQEAYFVPELHLTPITNCGSDGFVKAL